MGKAVKRKAMQRKKKQQLLSNKAPIASVSIVNSLDSLSSLVRTMDAGRSMQTANQHESSALIESCEHFEDEHVFEEAIPHVEPVIAIDEPDMSQCVEISTESSALFDTKEAKDTVQLMYKNYPAQFACLDFFEDDSEEPWETEHEDNVAFGVIAEPKTVPLDAPAVATPTIAPTSLDAVRQTPAVETRIVASDGPNILKSLLHSTTEQQLYRLLLELFPGYLVYPHMPLQHVLDVVAMGQLLQDVELQDAFCLTSVDFCLVDPIDQRPLFAVDLQYTCDGDVASNKDKDTFCYLGGLQLLRISPTPTMSAEALRQLVIDAVQQWRAHWLTQALALHQ